MVSERDYDARSDYYADQNAPVRGIGPAVTGAAAASAGRDFLIGEYGSEAAVQAEIRRGRPRLGESRRGASPSVRGRLTDVDYAAFKELEVETGLTQSDLVREGVHLLLQAHHKAAS